jgi:peptide subunit release factor 1 (eRF1)
MKVSLSEVYEAQRFCFECPNCQHYNDHMQTEPKDGDTELCSECKEQVTFSQTAFEIDGSICEICGQMYLLQCTHPK